MNSIGTLFRLTTFGESHGEAIGGIVDGMPAGIVVDENLIREELKRRRTGQSPTASQRQEDDEVRLLSGVFEGKTTGTPIAFIIENTDAKPADYEPMRDIYRPSHADYVYQQKYGHRDHRGGGRASARILASRVVAGALAKMVLKKENIIIEAFTSQIGNITLNTDYQQLDISKAKTNTSGCPDTEKAKQMEQLLSTIKKEGDSVGGIATCVIRNCPVGLGEPEFGKFHASLAAAMLSINACRAFEIGDGWLAAGSRGSLMNDELTIGETKNVVSKTNHSGGIIGGITTGEDIFFRVAFKPIPTIMRQQQTVNKQGKEVTFTASGRHDICVLPRVLPIIESMAAITLLDYLLISRSR